MPPELGSRSSTAPCPRPARQRQAPPRRPAGPAADNDDIATSACQPAGPRPWDDREPPLVISASAARCSRSPGSGPSSARVRRLQPAEVSGAAAGRSSAASDLAPGDELAVADDARRGRVAASRAASSADVRRLGASGGTGASAPRSACPRRLRSRFDDAGAMPSAALRPVERMPPTVIAARPSWTRDAR